MSTLPTASPAAAPDLLAELMAAFGTKPPRVPRGKAPRKSSTQFAPLPLPQAFSKRKTGYVTWKATHRVIQIQKQVCNCCGAETEAVKGEYFALENGLAHASWQRVEAYGISAPEDLPNVFVDLDPTFVTACAECRSTPFDSLDELLFPRQLSLEL